MDRNNLIKRLMATFLGELDEHVRTINRDLLALEKDPVGPGRGESFGSLLRAAHSLKGAARSVNVGPIESVSHLLEELVVAGRDGLLAFDHGLFALLFASADAIEEAGTRLREQVDLLDSPLVALPPRLEAPQLTSRRHRRRSRDPGSVAASPVAASKVRPGPGSPATHPRRRRPRGRTAPRA